ncbi:MAG TPA: helix-turn-helix domain-containing protein [Pyrinomonadaceae bacterium]|nr:helix-turn-helix domain-containing protein [Pyrinomonadaceae bacterium]
MLHYRELPPAAEISHLAFLFFELASEPMGKPFAHELFPDGTVSLIYHRNSLLGIEQLLSAGLRATLAKVPVRPGDIFWGMRVAPAAAALLVGGNPRGLPANSLGFPSALEPLGQKMMSGFKKCENLEDAVSVFSAGLKDLGVSAGDIDDKVAAAVEMIETSGGIVKISEIATALSLSTRQFQRRFAAATGSSPKQYARIRRFYRTATVLASREKVNWAERAAAMGFADQAHLSRELSALTGRSPHSFARRVRAITHGKLVK